MIRDENTGKKQKFNCVYKNQFIFSAFKIIKVAILTPTENQLGNKFLSFLP